MPLRYLLSLLLLIVTPLVVMAWLGTAALTRQQEQQREVLRSVFEDRLVDLVRDLKAVSQRYETGVGQELVTASRNLDALRRIRQSRPEVRATMLVDRDGRLVYPASPGPENKRSLAWHAALVTLARSRPMIAPEESADSSTSTPTVSLNQKAVTRGSRYKQVTSPSANNLRWQSWYHEGGLQLVLWLPRTDRSTTGVVLERGRWMADLIEVLPDTATTSGTYRLTDAKNEMVYSWGQPSGDAGIDQPEDVAVLASIRLSQPWKAWQLEFVPDQATLGETVSWGNLPLLASLVAIAVAVLGLGLYLTTSLQRQMNLAQQRVSFASHVSHELRTPLTNIRLYAELARRDLQDAGDQPACNSAAHRIDVIEEETQRLSRIVTGVLDMVSGRAKLKPSIRVPDDVLRQSLEGFVPALQALEITVETDLQASNAISMDNDVAELVIVNLLSNVEKYAGQGATLQITSRQDESTVTMDFVDNGPGISRSDARQIFRPFVRLDHSLSAPAGTGLGLSIARGAARRHGGDLVWSPHKQSDQKGAHFRFTFRRADAHQSKKKS